eukprot:TRINITY_DN1807_c2_g1_i1.p1 TRINITY_DN1807_c2_g1~~TRINITY_DN1807_c2_g1_i1.p1  ORF type:complete len:218 (-),score=54.84 TRINITY_DN1807_c2_g1_i1:182-835(-)
MPLDPKDLLQLLKKGETDEEDLLELLKDDVRARDPLEDKSSGIAHQRDKDGWSPLHWAAQDGHERLAEKLIEMRVSTNSADQCGATPLMIAAFNGRIRIIEALLLERSTDVRQVNTYLTTALHYAAQRGHANCIQSLVEAGAEVDALDRHSDTPLSWAARAGHLDAVKKLLELKADPLLDNNASEDSIEMAEAAGWEEVAELMQASLEVANDGANDD